MVKRYLTTNLDHSVRLDQYFHLQTPELSRTKTRKIVDLGGVRIHGHSVRKCGRNMYPLEKVELYQDHSPLAPYRLCQTDILFQDKYIIILNKTARIETQPTPETGTFHSYLQRNRNTHRMHSTTQGGKEAITYYQVQKTWADRALVTVQLITERTHQIRAHFSETGQPLFGDQQYGGPKIHEGARWPRQCLHSWILQLNHPKTEKLLSFTASVPSDMALAQ